MAESVLISNVKENILEFDAEVKGIKDPKMSVNFVIKTKGVSLSFTAKQEKGSTWSVVVPPIKMLEVGDTHPYVITVDVEGYHFEPLTGEVQVVSEIKPRVSKPAIKREEKKAEVKPEEKKADEEKKPEAPKKESDQKPPEEKKPEPKSEEKKVEETSEVDPLAKTIDSIITRETLRRSPTDVAIRKVLGEVKKPTEPEPTVVAGPTPEQIAEELQQAERLAREEAVRNILKGMSGTKASIKH